MGSHMYGMSGTREKGCEEVEPEEELQEVVVLTDRAHQQLHAEQHEDGQCEVVEHPVGALRSQEGPEVVQEQDDQGQQDGQDSDGQGVHEGADTGTVEGKARHILTGGARGRQLLLLLHGGDDKGGGEGEEEEGERRWWEVAVLVVLLLKEATVSEVHAW